MSSIMPISIRRKVRCRLCNPVSLSGLITLLTFCVFLALLIWMLDNPLPMGITPAIIIVKQNKTHKDLLPSTSPIRSGRANGTVGAPLATKQNRTLNNHLYYTPPNRIDGANWTLATRLFGFVTTQPWCSGMTNLIWLYASLSSIAADLSRTALIPELECNVKLINELRSVFPNFANEAVLKTPNASLIHTEPFGGVQCCAYNDPSSLKRLSQLEYLRLDAYYLQSYRYFHNNEAHRSRLVLHSFKCAHPVVEKGVAVRQRLKVGSDYFLLCVHTRRGDAVGQQWASDGDFVRQAIPRVVDHLSRKHFLNRSSLDPATAMAMRKLFILFTGDDRNFTIGLINSLPAMELVQRDQLLQLPIDSGLTRGEEMCFSAHQCDALFTTSHGSTYGWWSAYLMRELARALASLGGSVVEKPVYYCAVPGGGLALTTAERFPSEWVPVRKDNKAL